MLGRAMLLYFVASVAANNSSVQCPPGWTAGWGTKCMKLAAASTQLGCAAACGENASLACIESQADEDLAALVAPADLSVFVWLGEYQWPMEPIAFVWAFMPNRRCTNGKNASSEVVDARFAPFQPNNFNGAEDCMARSQPGYADNKCQEVLP